MDVSWKGISHYTPSDKNDDEETWLSFKDMPFKTNERTVALHKELYSSLTHIGHGLWLVGEKYCPGIPCLQDKLYQTSESDQWEK